jgi:hypothetical protein
MEYGPYAIVDAQYRSRSRVRLAYRGGKHKFSTVTLENAKFIVIKARPYGPIKY